MPRKCFAKPTTRVPKGSGAASSRRRLRALHDRERRHDRVVVRRRGRRRTAPARCRRRRGSGAASASASAERARRRTARRGGVGVRRIGGPFGTGAAAHRAAACRWEASLDSSGPRSSSPVRGVCLTRSRLDPRARMTLDEPSAASRIREWSHSSFSRPRPRSRSRSVHGRIGRVHLPDFCERDHATIRTAAARPRRSARPSARARGHDR